MLERKTFRHYVALVKSAGSAWIDDYAPSMGAALSYQDGHYVARSGIISANGAQFPWHIDSRFAFRLHHRDPIRH